MPFDPDQLPVPDLGLICSHCGYPLAYLSEHRCPECGRAFTMDQHVPPGAFPRLIAGGKEVRLTPAVGDLMDRYHIPVIELDDPVTSAFGGLTGPFGAAATGRPIGVPRESYLEAIDLIRRQVQGETMPPPPEGVDQSAQWVCENCGETNPGGFEVCWNCQADRPEDDVLDT